MGTVVWDGCGMPFRKKRPKWQEALSAWMLHVGGGFVVCAPLNNCFCNDMACFDLNFIMVLNDFVVLLPNAHFCPCRLRLVFFFLLSLL